MTVKWKGPDGVGFHYATSDNGHIMNVKYTPFEGSWTWLAYVAGEQLDERFDSLIDAKIGAAKAAAKLPSAYGDENEFAPVAPQSAN